MAQLFLKADSNVLSPSIFVWEEITIYSLNAILNFLTEKNNKKNNLTYMHTAGIWPLRHPESASAA